jgi:hypothetical protein
MNRLFQEDLLKDENILWTGQPETTVFFTGADIFLIPFSLLWGGFAIFWQVTVLTEGAPVSFALFGIPFVLLGLYLIFGRFIYKMWRKKNTYYAVTNRRVLVLTKLRSRNIQAAYIDTIPSISKSVRFNGTGTVRFGNPHYLASMYANTGLDFFGSFYGEDVPTFYDIKDVGKVYEMVNELRRNPRL